MWELFWIILYPVMLLVAVIGISLFAYMCCEDNRLALRRDALNRGDLEAVRALSKKNYWTWHRRHL